MPTFNIFYWTELVVIYLNFITPNHGNKLKTYQSSTNLTKHSPPVWKNISLEILLSIPITHVANYNSLWHHYSMDTDIDIYIYVYMFYACFTSIGVGKFKNVSNEGLI